MARSWCVSRTLREPLVPYEGRAQDEQSNGPNPADLLAVKSRVSWGAIAAGAMVALTIYIVLTLLGLAGIVATT